MNNFEIEEILKKYKGFLGVYTRDYLPTIKTYPCYFIVNTDILGGPGIHWIAFYLPNRDACEYYDTFALLPDTYNFGGFLKHYKTVKIFGNPIQSLGSKVCGQYCVFFILKRIEGFTMQEIKNSFTENTTKNDFKVCNYMKKYYSVKHYCLNYNHGKLN